MRRVFLPFALLLAVSLVFAGCGGKSKSKSAGELAYISINTDSASGQWAQAQAQLLRMFAGPMKQSKALSNAGVMLVSLEQALGKVTDVVVLGDAKKPALVMLTEPKDAAKLKALLAKAPGKTKPVTAEIGSWLAVADSQAALDQYQSIANKAKLTDSSSFKEAMAALPADALIKAYVPGATVTDGLVSLSSLMSKSSKPKVAGFSLSVSPKSLLKVVEKNPLDWAGLAVSAVPGGISVEGIFKGKTIPAGVTSSLMNELPSGTAFFVDLNGKTLGLEKAVANLGNNDKYRSQIAQIEATLGVKLEDFAALSGSEMAIYGTASGIGVLIKAPDPAKASLIANKGLGLLSSFLGAKGKKVKVGGVAATELTLGKIKVYLGVKGGDLFLTTDVATLKGGSKLPSDPVYTAATKVLPVPSVNDGVLFIDFKQLAALNKRGNSLVESLGKSLMSSMGASKSSKSDKSKSTAGIKPADVQAGLQNVSSLLGYVTTNGDKVEFKVLMTVKGSKFITGSGFITRG